MAFLRTLAVQHWLYFSLASCKSIPSYSSDYAKADKTISGIPLTQEQATAIGVRFTTAFNTLSRDLVKCK